MGSIEDVNDRVGAWVLDAAPNLKKLMSTECLYDISEKCKGEVSMEAVPNAKPIKGMNIESLPLPVTFADCNQLDEVRELANLVGTELDKTLMAKLGEAAKTVRANIHEAQSILAGNGFYGPYERFGDFVVAVDAEVLRVIVALRPRVVQLENRFRVECIIVPDVRKAYRGEVGIERVK